LPSSCAKPSEDGSDGRGEPGGGEGEPSALSNAVRAEVFSVAVFDLADSGSPSSSCFRMFRRSSGRPTARWLSLYSSTLARRRRRVSGETSFSRATSASSPRNRLGCFESLITSLSALFQGNLGERACPKIRRSEPSSET